MIIIFFLLSFLAFVSALSAVYYGKFALIGLAVLLGALGNTALFVALTS